MYRAFKAPFQSFLSASLYYFGKCWSHCFFNPVPSASQTFYYCRETESEYRTFVSIKIFGLQFHFLCFLRHTHQTPHQKQISSSNNYFAAESWLLQMTRASNATPIIVFVNGVLWLPKGVRTIISVLLPKFLAAPLL